MELECKHSYKLGYGLDEWGLIPDRARERNFPFNTASTWALGTIQLPTQWVPGASFLRVKAVDM